MTPRTASALLALALLSTGCVDDRADDGADGGPADAAATTTFHVSCDGDDERDGTTPDEAWRTLARANEATLGPGDRLLLERGCTWDGDRLDLTWSGTEDARIEVDAYGDGPLPRIVNGAYQDLKFTGSYTTARNLSLGYTDLDETPCGQPIGDVFAVNFTGGAHHNTIAESDIWGATAGVHLGRESSANRVIHNEIHDNVVKKSEETDPSLDLGAWGVLVVSDDNEVAYNTLRDNVAPCRNQGAPPSSNSIELFEGSDNRIHHNWSYGDRVFSELGSSDVEVASGNRWDYNLMVSDLDDAVFLITRGEGGEFGPVFDTTATHNTVYLTGERSDAVVCGNGCGPDVLTLTGNVLDARRKALFSDSVFSESHNVFWSSSGTPTLQSPIELDPTSAIVDPGFADPATLDLRPGAGSPLIDAAGRARTHDEDLDRAPVDERPDIGAFERQDD